MILALERQALDRWGKGDPGGFLAISAPDITYFDPFQETRIDGLPALKALYATIRGKIKIDRDEMIDPRVQLFGDAAVLSYRFISHGSEGAMRWNCTEVYQSLGGEWSIVHSHWSFAPAAPGAPEPRP
jgi:ketosteroid isomerase-like protein